MPTPPLLTLLNRITTDLTVSTQQQPLPPKSPTTKPTKPAPKTTNTTTTPTDPILSCPPSTLSLLPTHPSALIKLSHAKIHSYPFSCVPACWLRLYTDASVWEAVRVIGEGVEYASDGGGGREGRDDGEDSGDGGGRRGRRRVDGEEGGEEEGHWIQRAVRLLDMAVIIAGAVGREGEVRELMEGLQGWVEEREEQEKEKEDRGVGEPPRKKQRTRGGKDENNHNEQGTFTFPTEVLNPPSIRHPIPTVANMSPQEFETHLKRGGGAQPVIIKGALEHWPAFHGQRAWKNPGYLLRKTFGGRRLVPVEIGRSYTDEGWGQRIMSVREFMERWMLRSRSSSGKGEGGDEDEVEEKDGGIAYLAQHDLLAQIPSLRNDISIPDYCYTTPPPPAPGTPLASKPPQPHLDEPILNTWFGPAGTVSPLHTDPYHNILCQVVGKKYVRLYAPEESAKVYPRGREAGGVDMSNTSEVDVEGWDEERWPLFGKARYVEGIVGEGECLYVPVGCWHYVRALTASWSVSFWWN